MRIELKKSIEKIEETNSPEFFNIFPASHHLLLVIMDRSTRYPRPRPAPHAKPSPLLTSFAP